MEYTAEARQVRDPIPKSINAEELTQSLIQCLAVAYGIQPNQLLAAIGGGAAVNEAGSRQVFLSQYLNVICFSHTIDNIGKQFEFSVQDTFPRCWNTMFSLSPAAQLLWKTRTAWEKGGPSIKYQMVEEVGSLESGDGVFLGCRVFPKGK